MTTKSEDMLCKGYAAWADMEITLLKDEEPIHEGAIGRTLPEDANSDRIADRWQRGEVLRWNLQFGFQHGNPEWIDSGDPDTWEPVFGTNGDADAELAHSLGPNGSSPAMADDGDGLSALQEYRGYFLDGGPGLSAPLHQRLSVSRKEFLVECSVEANLADPSKHGEGTNANVIAGFDFNATMGDVSDFYRDAAKGGMIDLYWVVDHIDMPGVPIDYQGHFPNRNSREWSGAIRYPKDPANNVYFDVQGVGIPTFDHAYLKIDEIAHRAIYSYASGDNLLLQANKNPSLAKFGHIMLPGRIGRLWGGLNVDLQPDSTIPRYLECPLSSLYHGVGSVVAPAAVADEGATFWGHLRAGQAFTEDEYKKLLVVTIAHELGHILVGPWHPSGIGELTIMGGPFVRQDGSVAGRNDVYWHNIEIEKINLRAANGGQTP